MIEDLSGLLALSGLADVQIAIVMASPCCVVDVFIQEAEAQDLVGLDVGRYIAAAYEELFSMDPVEATDFLMARMFDIVA